MLPLPRSSALGGMAGVVSVRNQCDLSTTAVLPLRDLPGCHSRGPSAGICLEMVGHADFGPEEVTAGAVTSRKCL
ncbi:hypothetical protein OH76DRAFT_1411230 [Lentinus brumalis]|uniref:Uncharacterized protein n=1 Tax=Lentinus brumalis TaxID=2498619 RepID=A0A371CPY8_9APHY|nr:hypothetical protein OH76DRAFT_1411230 [Polyporus brumalis]